MSTIRDWLNSTEQVVTWTNGLFPEPKEDPKDYRYDPDPGFLSDGNFTASERSVIKTVKLKQVLSGLDAEFDTYGGRSAGGTVDTTDRSFFGNQNGGDNFISGVEVYKEQYAYDLNEKVFLLDIWQIQTLWENRVQLPVDEEWENSFYASYDGKKAENWVGRTPRVYYYPGTTFNGADLLGASSNWQGIKAKPDVWGYWSAFTSNRDNNIRPAFYLNTSVAIIKSGSGTKGNPYVIDGPKPPPPPVTKTITVTIGAPVYKLDGKAFDAQALTYNGVAYLPAAYLAQKLGLTARWDAATNVTYLTSGSKADPASAAAPAALPAGTKTITATLGVPVYMLDGSPFEEQALTYNGVAYLPAVYLATKLGLTAVWDKATNTTNLSSK